MSCPCSNCLYFLYFQNPSSFRSYSPLTASRPPIQLVYHSSLAQPLSVHFLPTPPTSYCPTSQFSPNPRSLRLPFSPFSFFLAELPLPTPPFRPIYPCQSITFCLAHPCSLPILELPTTHPRSIRPSFYLRRCPTPMEPPTTTTFHSQRPFCIPIRHRHHRHCCFLDSERFCSRTFLFSSSSQFLN
jgi:hypothetical protein